ncbi:VCBS repeat-containing protein [bacterium]|nr:VCBS repeat-containing protein [bacterium]
MFSIFGWIYVASISASFAGDLEKLAYRDPSLVVDLGVGLWAWPIPADADGDGDFDLFVSCPDVPSNGIWLFENVTGPTNKQPMPVFKPARRLSKTVHYVMPSYVHGTLRVLSPRFEYPDFLHQGLNQRHELAVSLPIHVARGKAKGTRAGGIRHDQWRFTDFDGDHVLDLVVGIEDWSDYGWDNAFDPAGQWTNGPLHGFIYLLRNEGSNEAARYQSPVKIEAGGKPIDVYGCPSPNFEDFDGDGDLDLVCGEFLDGFTYFENRGTRTKPTYAKGMTLVDPEGHRLAMNVQMIVPVAFDWDADGDTDLVVGDEDGRVAFVENTGRHGTNHSPLFLPPKYFRQQAETLKCGALANPVGADWDGDGDFDIVAGCTAGTFTLFENTSGAGVTRPSWKEPQLLQAGGKPFRVMAGPNGGIQGPCEAKWGYTTLSVADWDIDGDLDIVFNSIWGRVCWLENVGTRTNPTLREAQPIQVDWPGPAPKPAWTWWEPTGNELVTQWRTTPVVYDATGDKLPDLIMLDHEGYLSLFERASRDGKLLLLPGKRVLMDEKGEPLRLNAKQAGGSGRRKLAAVDWDRDGRFDLLLNSANADLLRQVDQRDGKWFFQNVGKLAPQDIEGHDVAPTTVDFDGDGWPEFLGGAEDGRLYWMDHPDSPQ